jgi:signal transduction histidine kinase
MLRSIRWRLVASYALLTVLTAGVVGVLSLEIVRRYVQRQEVNDLRANAQTVAQQAYPLLLAGAPDYELKQLVQTASFLGNVRVRLLSAQGGALVDSGLPNESNDLLWITPPRGQVTGMGNRADWPNLMLLASRSPLLLPEFEFSRMENLPPGISFTFIRRSYSPWGSRFEFKKNPGGGNLVANEAPPRSLNVVKEPIGDPAKPLGYVEMSAAPDFGTEALATTRRALIFAGAGAVFLAAIVGLLISQRLTSPLRSLTETAGKMSAGDLSGRVPIKSRDEIGELAATFNQMAERLEASFQQVASERDALRRFIADASHELRTPIAALKNFNALLLGPAAGDPEAQSEFLNESQAQINRLEWITNNLLDLSRMEAGLIELDYGHHAVGEIIQAVLPPFEALAAEKRITLSTSLPPNPVHLNCDRSRTEIALSNLLDNAIKFTHPGGEVEIGAVDTGQVVQVWVRDNGVGIHPEDMPHIFNRFYRGRNKISSGSGLGLSIVKSAVEAQGGRVYSQSAPGEGSKFVLEWPSAWRETNE